MINNYLTKRLYIISFFAVLIIVITYLNVASAQTPSYPLDSLTKGQEGFAVTATVDNELVNFPITVLALQYDLLTDVPLVLIRARGEFIESVGGVAAGMSGSPVYIDLENQPYLLGAIGYTFPNSDHSLALVTPIEVMKGSPILKKVPAFGAKDFPNLAEARPVVTPLLLSGGSERTTALLSEVFKGTSFELMPVRGTTSSMSKVDEGNFVLQAGSPISVQLIRGDITLSAIGTLTLIEGNKFWAFGHPLVGRGATSFALSPAFITHIVPSDITPFKLGNNGQRILGAVTLDNNYAIGGILNIIPKFIPINLSITSEGKTIKKHFEVSDDERFYAALVAVGNLLIFDELLAQRSKGTIDIAWEIDVREGQTVRVLEQISHPDDIASIASELIAAPLDILAENIFEDPDISKVNISLEFEPEERFAEIVEVVAENEELYEGDTLTAYVRLQLYRQDPEVITIRVPLPEGETGSFDLTFRGGLESEPSDEEDSKDGFDKVLSFTELLVALREQVQASEMVVEAIIDDEDERLARESFPYLIKGSEELTIDILEREDDKDKDEDENEDKQKKDEKSLEEEVEDSERENLHQTNDRY